MTATHAEVGVLDTALGTGTTVALPSGRVAYTERGCGSPVVFVHGLLVNADMWRKVVPATSGVPGFRRRKRPANTRRSRG